MDIVDEEVPPMFRQDSNDGPKRELEYILLVRSWYRGWFTLHDVTLVVHQIWLCFWVHQAG
jgi:hypothetical protein